MNVIVGALLKAGMKYGGKLFTGLLSGMKLWEIALAILLLVGGYAMGQKLVALSAQKDTLRAEKEVVVVEKRAIEAQIVEVKKDLKTSEVVNTKLRVDREHATQVIRQHQHTIQSLRAANEILYRQLHEIPDDGCLDRRAPDDVLRLFDPAKAGAGSADPDRDSHPADPGNVVPANAP